MKVTARSSLWAMRNWTSTMKSNASSWKLPTMRIAIARAIPTTERRDFTGLRPMCRAIMRAGWDRRRLSPRRSIAVSRYFSGGSGRIAWAGGSRAAFRTDCSVPSRAAAALTRAAVRITEGRSTYFRYGNR